MPVEGKSFSILLIKKDLEDLHFLRKSLEGNSTFPSKVDLAPSLEDALSRIERRNYDLFLLESEVEEETVQMLEKINRKTLKVPFVLLLPVKDDFLVREAIRSGVADVIIKSEHQFHELAERLRKACQSSNFQRKFHTRTREQHIEPEPAHADISLRDELTGLYSHGYLYERVVREFSRASRYGFPISCVMIDMDGFKTINEDFGHLTGEKILKEAAELLFTNCRLSDFIARYSGKRFCMVLPHSGYEGAKELANRIRQIFENHIFLADSHKIKLTVSLGISAFPDDVMTHRGDLITYASEALLHSKTLGRNRVTLFKEIVPAILEDLPSMQISEDKVAVFQRRMSEINSSFRRAYMDASKTLIMALESKDKLTAGHSASTAKYSFWLAQAMGLGRDEAEAVRHAALLHDVGKICIPDNILLKPGRLTLAEFETMKQHTYFGYKMLKPIRFLQQEALMVLHHHEWFNGEGYPCRLKAHEIPLGARIIGVVDSFDTMRSAGSRYKQTFNIEEIVNELIACAGTQFDPEVVKAFIGVLKHRGEFTTNHYNVNHLEELIKLHKPKLAPPAA